MLGEQGEEKAVLWGQKLVHVTSSFPFDFMELYLFGLKTILLGPGCDFLYF